MVTFSVDENHVPKEATQQILFLQKYPEFDGRGIKVAIIDTDVVDASLPGFQKTSTGLPKIIYFMPTKRITVDTSVVVETSDHGYVHGMSGRKIKIPSYWGNVNDKWHFGRITFKKLFELNVPDRPSSNWIKNLNKLQKCENLNYKIKILGEKELFSLKDKIIDCLVWFDGEKWRACIDTSIVFENSDPENMKVLTNFDDENEFTYFVNDIFYCVNISDDGNLLNLFSPYDDHGTTVTQVAAGYFPENPEGSGLAPGAQIVLLNWDNVEEALQKCIELKVDILNFSCAFSNLKYISIKSTIKQMVEEHGIIIVQAAGNLGPFHSTIRPQYTYISKYVCTIGAAFTKNMKHKFSFDESAIFPAVYESSSRGPLPSGDRGIDFVAPGDAIVDLPKWYPMKNKLCSGTSFAAPNVAGSIACLLSALKANKIPYSPAMIKMALANTAFLPAGGDKLAFGHGIIQIYDAFEFIKKSTNILPMKSLAPISIDQFGQNGILHIQNKYKLPQEYRYYINFNPELDIKWILKCKSSVEKFISYSKIDNFFIVKTFLEEGSLNYAEIHGIDSLNPSIGPSFYLPITVICPADPSNFNKEITVNRGSPPHLFFQSPSESQQFDIEITLLEKEDEKENKIPKMQQKKKTKEPLCSKNAFKMNTKKRATDVSTVKIKFEKEITLEYCQKKLIKFWKKTSESKRFFKFTIYKKTQTKSICVEKDEESFEIRFFHTYSDSLKINIQVSLQKSDI